MQIPAPPKNGLVIIQNLWYYSAIRGGVPVEDFDKGTLCPADAGRCGAASEQRNGDAQGNCGASGISKKYLEQIALVLSQAGILRGARGHQGGYRLAIAPEKLSVAEIIRVMEGSLAPVACLDRHPNECERCNECQTLFVWEGLDRVIQGYLEGITLQDVLAHPLP